ncbi:Uncharacterised protein [Chryseobacterium nakagawai]|uniref:Uncharacterized protein n=1 Tax=Chryseobacterium nakagawai TaxID=1241982 RepID=A0AAD0YMA7_CHRNA|nr:hypothetical protein [Chryseobacterium nakagawai]AZA91149.1 hypothetical protein EG343_11160 [Chryseobacterium nakagawai]VEH22709.1 Uncharacterised protein [Chryseobacterium nakagawai]
MKRLRIKQQNFIILAIIDALKTSVLGKGLRKLHDIKIERGHYDSCIQFTRKDGKYINPIDFFMFGHLIGRDYDK